MSATPPAAAPSPNEVLIENAVVMTVTQGNIQNGSIYIKNGQIAAAGKDVTAPSSATVVDAGGQIRYSGNHRLAFAHCTSELVKPAA